MPQDSEDRTQREYDAASTTIIRARANGRGQSHISPHKRRSCAFLLTSAQSPVPTPSLPTCIDHQPHGTPPYHRLVQIQSRLPKHATAPITQHVPPDTETSSPEAAFGSSATQDAARSPALLFTAFEPSGDDHASAVISVLRRRFPTLTIYAWGGRKMEAAGATLIERTGDNAVMGLPGIQKIIEHKRINQRIAEWLTNHPISLHVPVDSPAANTPICEITKARGVKIVHLVAPQIWAWGRWRIHKLRRLTDLVLCMLPFEPDFFARRNVPARFIGHFLFEKPMDEAALDRRAAAFGDGAPRIAMMPGSRPEELELNFPLLLDAFGGLRAKHPNATGVVAATSDHVADQLRLAAKARGGWPEHVRIVVQDTDAAVRWCTIALVKSGTVTLQVARQGKPMVIFYKKSSPVLYLMALTVLSTKVFSLPNIIARGRVVPEFIPHFGNADAIIAAADELISNPAKAAEQTAAVANVMAPLRGVPASELAADAIAEIANLGQPASSLGTESPTPRLIGA